MQKRVQQIIKLSVAMCMLIIGIQMSVYSAGTKWHWQEKNVEITNTGDLEWSPESFQFTPGSSIRYIDYENGNDNNTGASRSQAWKHHPWDPAATGNAKAASGIHTYVFKRGVIYRGELRADESGAANNPIRLTSDPSWGSGEAMFYGSEKVTGTWVQGAHASMPDETGIWHTDLTFAPRRLHMIDNGTITPINLARTPNWKVSDPDDIKSEWWKWQVAGTQSVDGKPVVRGNDPANLTKPADYYMDAIIYAEGRPIMGMPTPSRVINFDATNNMITFNDPFSSWGAMGVQGDCSYYLEDKPHFLDSPGEFWFDKNGDGGRLYVRLPGNRNPNQVHIEAAKRLNLVILDNQSNIHISGITFRFTNIYWIIDQHLGVDDVRCAVILQHAGQGANITVKNCKFEHVNQAFRMEGYSGSADDLVMIADNEIHYTDHPAVSVKRRGAVRLLRNNISEVSIHPYAGDHGGSGIDLLHSNVIEAAGNIIHRTYGVALMVSSNESPLNRVFVHHNKVTDAMLNARDWGAIECNDGGPHYIYSNIVGNPGPGGNWAPGYYFDGNASKKYLFNNVAWGKLKGSVYTNNTALQQIFGFGNVMFNNTFYKFTKASNRQRSEPQRNHYIGNLILDMDEWGFYHTKVSGYKDPNPTHLGKIDTNFDYQTVAYARNVFFKPPEKLAAFDSPGNYYTEIDAFNRALAQYKTLSGNGASVVNADPVKDAGGHDFHLTNDGSAINKGGKVFVPFPLYMVIGEYNFHRNNADPANITDEHWYHAPYYSDRYSHRYMPRFTLKGENIGAGNYGKGDLEDWTTSALYLNGSNQYAHITHAEMKKDIVYPKGRNENETGKVYGAYVICADMDKNNFLIELYCKVNSGRTGDLLLSKADATGYILEVDNAGKAQLRLRVGGNDVAKRSTTMAINDGKWHHIIAEVDRSVAQGIRLYIDGKQANGAFEGSMPSASASLKNTADLLVGGGPGKKYLAGAIDFLRISRGTLADAKTTIEELYDWQFVNGPHLTDFAGNEIEDNKRDAGAFEGRPSSIVSVTDRPLPAAVSLAAKHTAATLKAAVETGIQSGAEPSETVAVSTGNTGLYADSITVLLNGESMIVKDTLRVETKQKYDFTISADKTEFTLSKVTDDGSVLVAASNSKNCRVTLEANQKYVYELRIQKSNTNECTLKWQEVKE